MEVLRLPGYTEVEKVEIAKRFLIPKQLDNHGISPEQLTLADDALHTIIHDYTREAGVRNLEREIGAICRKTAKSIAQDEDVKNVVTADDVHNYLGPERFFSEMAERADEPGVAIGLAWTQTGGDIIFVEAAKMKQTMRKGEALTLTGQLGDVMRESAQAALSYVRSRSDMLGIDPGFFEQYDIHLHVPAGATPKDGPSAGITMATVLASLATKTPVKEKLAMTGEITLRGRVLPVGGIKEKVLAASRAGIKEVIIPMKSKKDLEEIPEEIRNEMTFHLVDTMDEVLCIAIPVTYSTETLGESRESPHFPQPISATLGQTGDLTGDSRPA
jgi:ATP-dependent Lon protease